MTDLADWLLAQIAADEAAARDLIAKVEADPGAYVMLGLAHPELAAGDCPSWLGDYDPARVLADCEAHRAIVELYQVRLSSSKAHEGDLALAGSVLTLLSVVKLLAQPYAGRPGWDPAWRVET